MTKLTTTHRLNPRRSLAAAAALSTAILLAACGPEDGAPAAHAAAAPAKTSVAAAPAPRPQNLGTVSALVPIVAKGDATGAGAVVGGVLGAAVGNQIGGGDGRKVATVLGALGGAKVGHEVEKKHNEQLTGYRVDVVLDAGGTRSFTLASKRGYTVGQRVRVVDGALQPA